MSDLQKQINAKSKTIHVDKYSMSIGEIISLYNDEELDIHPEFQRFYRWTATQKTKLIESLLLNIPIPPIFVSQREDGIWDIVDGLQRISTILNFAGVYKDNDGSVVSPLQLESTKLLPALGDKLYDSGDKNTSFTIEERRYFKRAKLDFIILQKESDESSKFELFQRLNTGGTSLSPQEVRNCILVMISPERFSKFEEMSKYDNFKNVLGISEDALAERYDLELVSRFICLRRMNIENIAKVSDLSKYIDDEIINLFSDSEFNIDEELAVFKTCFDTIYDALGEDAFCKYNSKKDQFGGRFLVSALLLVR